MERRIHYGAFFAGATAQSAAAAVRRTSARACYIFSETSQLQEHRPAMLSRRTERLVLSPQTSGRRLKSIESCHGPAASGRILRGTPCVGRRGRIGLLLYRAGSSLSRNALDGRRAASRVRPDSGIRCRVQFTSYSLTEIIF
jgi:hypothetical protein